MSIDENLETAQEHLRQAWELLRQAYANIDDVGELVLQPILTTVNETHARLGRLRHGRKVLSGEASPGLVPRPNYAPLPKD